MRLRVIKINCFTDAVKVTLQATNVCKALNLKRVRRTFLMR